jgi:acyl-ACP thioesterase
MMDILRETTKVRFSDVDRSDRLTLGGIFNYFQEAAINHATALGVGRDALANTRQAWILSRLSLFVERRPLYGDSIEVSTWPRRWEKLFALRDYAIRDAEGAMLARGRGAWLVLDIEKRRPLRAQAIMEPLPPNDGINAMPANPASLDPRENMVKIEERTALYSDIDYYGHANNARIIQWILDATDMDLLTNASQARLDINYLSEVKPGETINLWLAPIENNPADINPEALSRDYPSSPRYAFAHEGRRPDTGQATFRAELRI